MRILKWAWSAIPAVALGISLAANAAKDGLDFDFGDLKLDENKIQQVSPATNVSVAQPSSTDLSTVTVKSIVAVKAIAAVKQTKVQVLGPSMQNLDKEVTVVVATGSEKESWFKIAAQDFMNDSAVNTINGKRIVVRIERSGSMSGMKAVASGDLQNGRNRYQAYSPASSMLQAYVERRYEGSIFSTKDRLAYSPMVFLTRADRQSLIEKQIKKPMSFDLITEAINLEFNQNKVLFDPSNQNWFYVGYTKPENSNSGTMGLISMAYEYYASKQPRYSMRVNDLQDAGFQAYLSLIKFNSQGDFDTTDDLKKIIDDPGLTSVYVYENTAMAIIKKLGGGLAIRYPRYNMITDHPFYVLRHGNTEEQISAATAFKDYLKSPKEQLNALKQGFRPTESVVEEADEEKAKTKTTELMGRVFGPFVQFGLIPEVNKAAQIMIPAQDPETVMQLVDVYSNLQPVERKQ